MSAPEQLVTANDFLARLRAGTKEVYEIKARGLTIPVRLLSIDERVKLRNEAIRENNLASGDQVSLAAIVQKKTLILASDIAGASSMPARFFDIISLDEMIFIYNEYQRICEEVNPSLEQVSEAEFKRLVDAIKKNSVTASDLSIPQLKAVFMSYQDLIQRLDAQISQTANSSGGQS